MVLKKDNQTLKLQLDQKKEIIDFEVQEILADRMKGKQKQYLVHWKGFNSKHDSWEPKKILQCPNLLRMYEESKQNKNK